MAKTPFQAIPGYQFDLLKRIPARRPGVSAASLVDSSRRPREGRWQPIAARDLRRLGSAFGLASDGPGAAARWRWEPHRKRAFLRLELADAVCLHLAEGFVGKLLPTPALRLLDPVFQGAEARIAKALSDGERGTGAAIRFTTASWLGATNEATFDFIAVNFKLATAAEPAALETIRPPDAGEGPARWIVRQRGGTFLVTAAFLAEDLRLYTIHRTPGPERSRPRRREAPPSPPLEGPGSRSYGLHELTALRELAHQKLTPLPGEGPPTFAPALDEGWLMHAWALFHGGGVGRLSPRPLFWSVG